MAEKKQMSQKKRVVLFITLSALAMLLCMAVVMGVAVSLMTDGVYEFEKEETQYVLPADGQETVDFVLSAVESAKDENIVYLNTSVNEAISDLEYSGSESENKLLEHMKGTIFGNIDAMYPSDYSGSFADGFKAYPVIDLSDVKVTETKNELNSTKIRSVITTDRFIPGLDTGSDKAAAENITSLLSDVMKVTSSSVTEEGVEITSEINVDDEAVKNAGKINRLEIKRKYSVALTVEFINDLSALETRDFRFSYFVTDVYSYTWAGIECTDKVVLAVGEDTQISIKATLNDYSDYQTRFVSDNEEVATIDELGYIRGIRESEEPVKITVYLDYLGHEYSDECEVYVSTPVTKIEISDKKLAIKAGETFTLSAELFPENATDRTIIWLSDDENIATVENGLVKAVSAGETSVRAIAEDGSYQAVCTVTVS